MSIRSSGEGHTTTRPLTVGSWKVFLALETHCRVDTGGYCGLEDVRNATDGGKIDEMPSYFTGVS